MRFELLNLSLCLVENTMAFVFFNSILEKKFSSKKHTILLLLFILINTVILYSSANVRLILRNLLVLSCFFVSLTIMHNNKWYFKTTLIILVGYLLLIIDIILGSLFSIFNSTHFVEQFYSSFVDRLVISYTIKVINAIILMLIYRVLKKIYLEINLRKWLMLNLSFLCFWGMSVVFISMYPLEIVDRKLTILIFIASSGLFLTSMILINMYSIYYKGR